MTWLISCGKRRKSCFISLFMKNTWFAILKSKLKSVINISPIASEKVFHPIFFYVVKCLGEDEILIINFLWPNICYFGPSRIPVFSQNICIYRISFWKCPFTFTMQCEILSANPEIIMAKQNICVFQVSPPYLGFCPDPKQFIVNLEENIVKYAEKWGKI